MTKTWMIWLAATSLAAAIGCGDETDFALAATDAESDVLTVTFSDVAEPNDLLGPGIHVAPDVDNPVDIAMSDIDFVGGRDSAVSVVDPCLDDRGNAVGSSTIEGPYYVETAEDLAGLLCATRVTGNLVIEYSATLTEVELPHLREVTGSLAASGGSWWAGAFLPGSLALPALAEVGQNLTVNTYTLIGANLSALTHVAGDLKLNGTQLDVFSAPKLRDIGGGLEIRKAQQLKHLTFPALETISGGLRLSALVLEAVDFASLLNVGRFGIEDVSVPTLSLPSLRTIEGPEDYGADLHLESLETALLHLPVLESIEGSLRHEHSGIGTFHLPKLITVGSDFKVIQPTLPTTITLPALTLIGSSVGLKGAEHLEAVELSSLGSVGAGVFFESLGPLKSIEWPALETIGGTIVFQWGSDLESLSLPALTSASGVHGGAGITALETLSLPLLQSGAIDLKWAALSEVALGALESADVLRLSMRTGVTSVELPSLATVGGEISVTGPSLETVALPELTTLDTIELGASSPRNLIAPKLVDVVKTFRAVDSRLESLVAPNWEHVTTFEITGNANLAQCLVDHFEAQLVAAGGINSIMTADNNPNCVCDFQMPTVVISCD